jgi:hypothetical protein
MEDLNSDFPEAPKEINYISVVLTPTSPRGSRNSWSGRSQQSALRPKYLKWSEVPITFDQSDHPNFIPKSD